MGQGRTSPPDLLSERELLALMDANGIGMHSVLRLMPFANRRN